MVGSRKLSNDEVEALLGGLEAVAEPDNAIDVFDENDKRKNMPIYAFCFSSNVADNAAYFFLSSRS